MQNNVECQINKTNIDGRTANKPTLYKIYGAAIANGKIHPIQLLNFGLVSQPYAMCTHTDTQACVCACVSEHDWQYGRRQPKS